MTKNLKPNILSDWSGSVDALGRIFEKLIGVFSRNSGIQGNTGGFSGLDTIRYQAGVNSLPEGVALTDLKLNPMNNDLVRGAASTSFNAGSSINRTSVNPYYYRNEYNSYGTSILSNQKSVQNKTNADVEQNNINPESFEKAVNSLIRQEDMIYSIKAGTENIAELLKNSGSSIVLK
ncbi:MAG: hypothetical protein GY750_07155 [Lentisphaerae bacterium]|nr:hypothetical protein [Lentisphaerota bacterium]MCP4101187.1 hypothetical protein [Lentisphaerota bacterium]